MAEPLVLLPGMMCDARLFAPQIAAFSAGRTLHVPALRDGDTTEALAASVLAEAPPRFALAGLSLGGIVAMEVVRQAGERVTRLALLDTNPLAETAEMRAAREPQIEAVRGGGLAHIVEETRDRLAGARPLPEPTRDLVLAMALDLGPEVFVRQSRALQSRPDQTATLCAYRGPTLILCGAEDKATPVHRHALMQELMPHGRLVVIAEAGHLTTLEVPGAANDALAAWLAA